MRQSQIIVLLFAAFSLPFELVAKGCLGASALLFVLCPFPAARLLAIFSVIGVLGLARLRRLTNAAEREPAAPEERREHAD